LIYADTSAFVKRYISEAASERFDAFFVARAPLAISRLTLAEMRCALARRRRAGQIGTALERAAMEEVRRDIQDGTVLVHPVSDPAVAAAYHLIDQLADLPLRTLDALHISIALQHEAAGFASADRVQASAAQALGLETHTFF
jgi:predicted nucleic acid-binding protein